MKNMKLIKKDQPEWMIKIDSYGQFQLRDWQEGSSRPPAEIHCFIVFSPTEENKKILTDLGVVLCSTAPKGATINTGNIPYNLLQQVCELSFIQMIEFPKIHKISLDADL